MLLFSMYNPPPPPMYKPIPRIYAHLKKLTNLYKPRAYIRRFAVYVIARTHALSIVKIKKLEAVSP